MRAHYNAPDAAAMDTPILRLKHGEDRRLRAGHLWVFSNEVDVAATPLKNFAPGTIARLLNDRDQFLGYAYVNPATLICARIVSRSAAAPPNEAFFVRRLRAALALREQLGSPRHHRWVFGESDGLPGLVLDRFGDVVVGQIATAGMEALKPLIEAAVRKVADPAALVWKNDGGARDLENLPQVFETAFGAAPAELTIVEKPRHDRELQFRAPLQAGQKTGWFYDQTANRARLARYLPAGARVLDVCSYLGGWGVTAMAVGAASATCVDASQLALDGALANAQANNVAIDVLRGDAFDVLAELAARGQKFDAVVLDPPAFIKRRKDAAQGQAAYRKLNQLALRLIERDGLLVSCSCSWHLAPDELLGAIQAAARHVDRFVQVLEFGGQSPDHPVHPAIAETRYLKAFFCRVSLES